MNLPDPAAPWTPTARILETRLLAVLLLLMALALVGPFVGQPADYHAFADQRMLAGIPFTMDVLSNLAFAAWSMAGLWFLWPSLRVGTSQHWLALLFFAGLLVTAACSTWYHWHPDNAGLLVDRCGMVLAFAGLLGLAAAGRISLRAGVWLVVTVLLFGPLTVWLWFVSGNALPWGVLQAGGMALIVWFAWLAPLEGALKVRWGVVILIYVAAKVLEVADHGIYELTGHLISGHSLKHIVASCAAWPVVSALLPARCLQTKAE